MRNAFLKMKEIRIINVETVKTKRPNQISKPILS